MNQRKINVGLYGDGSRGARLCCMSCEKAVFQKG